MPLQTSTPAQFFTGITNAITALYQRRTPSQGPLNFTSGSILGAIANALVAWLFFLQNQIAYVFGVTRAATSTGADLTSWGADYGVTPTRVPASYANNIGTTSTLFLTSSTGIPAQTFMPASAASVNGAAPVGSGVVLQDGSTPPTSPLQYVLVADPANANYNAGTGGYTAPQGSTSYAVSVQALTAGTAGNAIAGTLLKIVTPGIPFTGVNQAADITNGQNVESDTALRSRQQAWVGALATATRPALFARLLSLQVGLTMTVVEAPPAFTYYVDDGTGAIPTATLTTIQALLNLNRAAGSGAVTAVAPTNETITVSITGSAAQSGFNIATVRAAVQAAIIAYINTNGVGGANASNNYGFNNGVYAPANILSYVGIAAVVAAFVGTGAGQGLQAGYALTVNAGSANVAVSNTQLARATTGSVTVA